MAHMEGAPVISVNPEFWKDRRVFVTGHTGFLGGWLCLWLSKMGAQVTGFSLAPPTRPNFHDAVGLAGDMCSIIGDIRRLNILSAAMRESDPQIVFHLAAQPLVRLAHEAPVETFSTNVMGTVHVLQSMRFCPHIEGAVIMTTDKVYDNVEQANGYREGDRLGGREPYGASKACAEFAVDAFRHAYFPAAFPIATARAGNIFGGGDWAADRIVPDAVRAFGASRRLVVRNPKSVRPWQHALDPARALLMLSERLLADPSLPRAWNFGPSAGSRVTVAELVEELRILWGNGASWPAEPGRANTPYEAKLLTLDSSLAKARLGWQPVWSLERALKTTVDWYQGFLSKRDMHALSLSQISAMEGAN